MLLFNYYKYKMLIKNSLFKKNLYFKKINLFLIL